MTVCKRCEGIIRLTDPRVVVDGETYHLYCGWKVERAKQVAESDKRIAEQMAVRNIGVSHETSDTVPDSSSGHAHSFPTESTS